MALTQQQQIQVRAEWGRTLSETRTAFSLSKPDLDAAIAAVDAWIDANASAYNLAIPQPARGALTAAQKAELLYRVALKRFGG